MAINQFLRPIAKLILFPFYLHRILIVTWLVVVFRAAHSSVTHTHSLGIAHKVFFFHLYERNGNSMREEDSCSAWCRHWSVRGAPDTHAIVSKRDVSKKSDHREWIWPTWLCFLVGSAAAVRAANIWLIIGGTSWVNGESSRNCVGYVFVIW